MSDMMTQEEAMNMSNEQAVQILIPMRNMMCDQNGCPISDAVFALDKAIEALSADRPQGWIPCSERLPREYSDDERVLATTDVDGLGVILIPIYDVVSWYRKGYISAWMPLPKPYEADRKTEPNSSEIPNNCEDCEHWSDTEDGCADRHGCTVTDCAWK